MRLVLSMLVALFLSLPVSAAEYLWSSADGGNDHWYYIRDELVTYAEVDDQLLYNIPGGAFSGLPGIPGYAAPTRADVESQAELDFIAYIMVVSSAPSAWIGLSDVDSPGVFAWTSGQPLSFTAWAPGEPAGSGGVVIRDPYDPLWETRDPAVRTWWLAEAAPVPEPAGIVLAALAAGSLFFCRFLRAL